MKKEDFKKFIVEEVEDTFKERSASFETRQIDGRNYCYSDNLITDTKIIKVFDDEEEAIEFAKKYYATNVEKYIKSAEGNDLRLTSINIVKFEEPTENAEDIIAKKGFNFETLKDIFEVYEDEPENVFEIGMGFDEIADIYEEYEELKEDIDDYIEEEQIDFSNCDKENRTKILEHFGDKLKADYLKYNENYIVDFFDYLTLKAVEEYKI